nr:uncharacterized protein LOC128684231 [Cherax quadricarinatus]
MVASRSLFLDHFHSHSHAIAVYTDGSKSSDGVGFAAVFLDSVVHGHLLSSASIFTAELYAILAALIRIASMPVSSFVVVSDSLSALQAIQKFDTPHPLVLHIQLWLHRIFTKHKDIVFCWVPGHVDVQGNEQADTAARSAVHDLPISYRGIPFTDYFAAISSHLHTRWQQRWSTMLGNELQSIKPSIGCLLSSYHQCRGWETTLSRLRIGHTRLTHGYLMERGALLLSVRIAKLHYQSATFCWTAHFINEHAEFTSVVAFAPLLSLYLPFSLMDPPFIQTLSLTF